MEMWTLASSVWPHKVFQKHTQCISLKSMTETRTDLYVINFNLFFGETALRLVSLRLRRRRVSGKNGTENQRSAPGCSSDLLFWYGTHFGRRHWEVGRLLCVFFCIKLSVLSANIVLTDLHCASMATMMAGAHNKSRAHLKGVDQALSIGGIRWERTHKDPFLLLDNWIPGDITSVISAHITVCESAASVTREVTEASECPWPSVLGVKHLWSDKTWTLTFTFNKIVKSTQSSPSAHCDGHMYINEANLAALSIICRIEHRVRERRS